MDKGWRRFNSLRGGLVGLPPRAPVAGERADERADGQAGRVGLARRASHGPAGNEGWVLLVGAVSAPAGLGRGRMCA